MALSHLVVQYESNFCTVALQFMEEEKNYPLPSPATAGTAAPGLRWPRPRVAHKARPPGHSAERGAGEEAALPPGSFPSCCHPFGKGESQEC